MPAIYKRIDERHLLGLEEGLQSDLLGTIRVPKSLLFLTERLPKANYSPLKTRKIEKMKFLQTLAGYKDIATHNSIADENTKETETIDSYKKSHKDYPKGYRPSEGKEAHQKYILKVYGDRDKEKRAGRVSKMRTERSQESNISNAIFDDSVEYDVKTIKHHNMKARSRIQNLDTTEDKEISEAETIPKIKNMDQASYRLPPYKAPYKIHNLNDDVVFEKQHSHQARIRQIYGEKSQSSIVNVNNSAIHVGKESINSMMRRHKNQVSGRSPSQE